MGTEDELRGDKVWQFLLCHVNMQVCAYPGPSLKSTCLCDSTHPKNHDFCSLDESSRGLARFQIHFAG